LEHVITFTVKSKSLIQKVLGLGFGFLGRQKGSKKFQGGFKRRVLAKYLEDKRAFTYNRKQWLCRKVALNFVRTSIPERERKHFSYLGIAFLAYLKEWVISG
jgi:hypothetical protein